MSGGGHGCAFQTGEQTRDAAARPGTDGIVIMPSGSGRSSTFRVPWTPDSHHCVTCILARDLRPHRLVVRTSRCGRDNPGSTPGVVMQVRRTAEIHGTDRMPDTPASMSGVGHAYAFQTGAQSARAAARAHMTSISCPTGSGGLRHSGVPGHQSLLDH